MATYVNDLRLKEIGTGESSGTWGTETNVNLELIGEALSFGTEAITTNADTHTSTVADGSTDPARSMYIKYTGTLDSACTITIAPNTLSRLHFIENGTSGSQNIIISQGSGANVTIPPGDVKVVYLDGAGSGAAVVDAFASLSTVDLKVQDDLTVTDDVSIGGALTLTGNADFNGDLDVDGTTNLDVVDIDGAVDMASTLAVGGLLTVGDGHTIGDDGDDNLAITGSSSENIIIDSAVDIILDAGGADVLLKDDGTQFARIGKGGGSDLIIEAAIADKDIFLTGTDGSSAITALLLDMSDAGTAIFNNKASFVGAIAMGQTTFTGGSVLADLHGSGSGVGSQAGFYNDHNTSGFFAGIAGNTTGNVILYNVADTDIEFYTNNAIAMTLKNSKRLGIGTTSPASALDVVETGTATAPIRSETAGGSANTVRNHLSMNTGGDSYHIATIRSNVNNDAYGIAFVENTTERFRMDNAGRLLIAHTTAVGSHSEKLGIDCDQASTFGIFVSGDASTGGSSNVTAMRFYDSGSSAGVVGSIVFNDTATAFNTSSDYRLKENVTYSWDATTRLKQLKPARFNFIKNSSNTVDGFLAHEVSSIVPNSVFGDKDETETLENVVLDSQNNLLDKDITEEIWTEGKTANTYPSDSTWKASHTQPVYQSIDNSKLVPLLVKTIQELEERITALGG